MIAGEHLKVIFAVAQDDPKFASWSKATRIVGQQIQKSRTYLYDVRGRFSSVIHLWAAWTLRDQKNHADLSRDYSALDDVYVFIAEAMALLQWGTSFKLDRDKAEPVLNRDKIDFWVPPPSWDPPVPKPGWPRDGRVQAVHLPDGLLVQ